MVKVIEECQISPPSGSSVFTTSLPLTLLDLDCFLMSPVEYFFFYEFLHPKTHFITKILPGIKHSLSLTLQHFYPLAGNIAWPQESTVPEIIYKEGDSVSFTVAESEHLHELSGNHARDMNAFNPLVPKSKSENSHQKLVPLMAIQVTLFPDKGFCISIAIAHAVADGRTFTHFIKSWASLCRGDAEFVTEYLPFFDRDTMINKHQKSSKVISIIKGWESFGITKDTFHFVLNREHVPTSVDYVCSTYVMSNSDIKTLKEFISAQLMKENQDGTNFHISSFVVTCAYLWVCWIKARKEIETSMSEEETEHFMIQADIRTRLNPPLPVTYFGNCIRSTDVAVKRSDLLKDNGIVIAAKEMGNGIRNLDVYGENQKDFSYYASLPKDQILSIAGSPKFGFYETDFGWGKPKKVERGGDSLCFRECPNEGGGIEIGIVGNKLKIDAFASIFANYIISIY